jgi:hypothetical protein
MIEMELVIAAYLRLVKQVVVSYDNDKVNGLSVKGQCLFMEEFEFG